MDFSTILVLFGIFLVIHAIHENSKKKKQQENAANTLSSTISLLVTSPMGYSTILNHLEDLVYSVVNKVSCEVSVVVQVRKIDNTYCSISCSLLADTSFRGVSFGEGFNVTGDDSASFHTNLATGFTTPNDVRQEITLQFNWDDLSVTNTKMSVLDYGDFLHRPLINYSFTARKMRS